MRIVILFVFFGVLEANELHQAFSDLENGVTKEIIMDKLFILDLIKRVELLESRDRSHAQEIGALKREVFSQKKEIAALHRKMEKQELLISRLSQRLLTRERIPVGGSANGNNTDAAAAVKTADKENVIRQLGNRIRRIENEVFVAFTAGLTATMHHIGAHQNIAFDHVETNYGNGYNPHHGVFTAPVDGIYLFYTSVLADNNREIWCRLVVNGKDKASAYARGTDGRHDQGSQAIIVQLQQGDDVAVQNYDADDSIYGSSGIYTTFSGFLLLQNYQQAGSIVG